ncbi:unnamed protein product, partial [Mesorhabditis spiculigera]
MTTNALDCSRAVDKRRRFISLVTDMMAKEGTDRRDEWPHDIPNDYQKCSVLSNGQFGMVVAALCRETNRPTLDPRACVLKIRYLGRMSDKILSPTGELEDDAKLEDLVKRLVTDVYIMNRMRHVNILHLHAVAVDAGDLTFVMPRFYCLDNLINMWRHKFRDESMPADLIMRIVRQICVGLDFLKQANVFHRTIQADNIYLTRNGRVKLAHFSAAKFYEKQFNLCEAESRETCLSYDGAADIWAIGILVLRMVTFFPNEQWQRLHPDFAFTMRQERMPFVWIIADLTQLRVRMRKAANGLNLCRWLSEKILTLKPSKRATPEEIIASKIVKKLCSNTMEEDCDVLHRRFISALDWPNRERLEADRPNYDCLESKDIPAEFYWDGLGTWKMLERAVFEFDGKITETTTPETEQTSYSEVSGRAFRLDLKTDVLSVFSGRFLFSQAHTLLAQLAGLVNEGRFHWCDLLIIDHLIREGATEAMRRHADSQRGSCSVVDRGNTTTLPLYHSRPRHCSVNVRLISFDQE